MGNAVFDWGWAMLFLTEGVLFPKMEKPISTIKDKKGPWLILTHHLKLWIVRKCHWINASEKLEEKSCISYGKDNKTHQK